MNLTMSFVFAALLVLIGAPRPLSNNNANTIVACAADAGTMAFWGAVANWDDDRLTASFILTSVTCSHSFLIPPSSIYRMSDELNSIKEKSRIYKLNSTFLI